MKISLSSVVDVPTLGFASRVFSLFQLHWYWMFVFFFGCQ